MFVKFQAGMCLTCRNFADAGICTTESDGGHSYILQGGYVLTQQ